MENQYGKWFSLGRGAWNHNVTIFHKNAGKNLQHCGNSKPHTDAVLAMISTTVDEDLSGLIGIWKKTDMKKM